jgi:hypothetical protein
MGSIFARASSVVIWLGPPADNSHMAFRLFHRITSQVFYDLSTRVPVLLPDAHDATLLRPHADLPSEEIGASVRLIHRQWFDRLWVRQEVSLADQDTIVVACGPCLISWKRFLDVWYILDFKKILAQPKSLERVAYIWKFFHQPKTSSQAGFAFTLMVPSVPTRAIAYTPFSLCYPTNAYAETCELTTQCLLLTYTATSPLTRCAKFDLDSSTSSRLVDSLLRGKDRAG